MHRQTSKWCAISGWKPNTKKKQKKCISATSSQKCENTVAVSTCLTITWTVVVFSGRLVYVLNLMDFCMHTQSRLPDGFIDSTDRLFRPIIKYWSNMALRSNTKTTTISFVFSSPICQPIFYRNRKLQTTDPPNNSSRSQWATATSLLSVAI